MKRRLLAVAAACAAALALSGCGDKASSPAASAPAAAGTAQVNVGIIQLVEHQALDAANKGIVDQLAARGYKNGEKIKIDQQNAQADQSNMKNIAQRFVSNKSAVIFAIATPAAQTVANTTKTIPIVGTAITDYEIAKLVKTNAAPGGNVTGTSDMNPIAEQAELIKKIFPNAKNVGVIYNSSEVNSEVQVKAFTAAADKQGMAVRTATVSSINDIQQAANSLIGKIDVIYVPTDNVVVSGLPTLIKVTNPAKVPVVGAEPGTVLAGAIATVGIDYYKLGQMTGDIGADILDGKAKPETTPIQFQKEFKVMVNESAEKALGVKVPDAIRNSAEIVK